MRQAVRLRYSREASFRSAFPPPFRFAFAVNPCATRVTRAVSIHVPNIAQGNRKFVQLRNLLKAKDHRQPSPIKNRERGVASVEILAQQPFLGSHLFTTLRHFFESSGRVVEFHLDAFRIGL